MVKQLESKGKFILLPKSLWNSYIVFYNMYFLHHLLEQCSSLLNHISEDEHRIVLKVLLLPKILLLSISVHAPLLVLVIKR